MLPSVKNVSIRPILIWKYCLELRERKDSNWQRKNILFDYLGSQCYLVTEIASCIVSAVLLVLQQNPLLPCVTHTSRSFNDSPHAFISCLRFLLTKQVRWTRRPALLYPTTNPTISRTAIQLLLLLDRKEV
jgi:hypothetical protein